MARRSATAPADAKAAKPLFSLLLGSDAFSHLCQLASGQVLSPESLLPWISEADLERLLFEGEGSRVIEVSRKRSFTGALRRLIEVRDRLCYHELCDEPAHRCQADHIIPWSEGGMTAQWNGRHNAASTTASGTEDVRRPGSDQPPALARRSRRGLRCRAGWACVARAR